MIAYLHMCCCEEKPPVTEYGYIDFTVTAVDTHGGVIGRTHPVIISNISGDSSFLDTLSISKNDIIDYVGDTYEISRMHEFALSFSSFELYSFTWDCLTWDFEYCGIPNQIPYPAPSSYINICTCDDVKEWMITNSVSYRTVLCRCKYRKVDNA